MENINDTTALIICGLSIAGIIGLTVLLFYIIFIIRLFKDQEDE